MSVIRPDFYDFGISSSTDYALKRRTDKLEFIGYAPYTFSFLKCAISSSESVLYQIISDLFI